METKNITISDDEEALFKSYYVVWKLCTEKTDKSITHCLNRTMQYGNHKERQEEWVSFEGLNRTMQYGNL